MVNNTLYVTKESHLLMVLAVYYDNNNLEYSKNLYSCLNA